MYDRLMTYNGIRFRRAVTLVGDVEKITWYNDQVTGYSEIHDQVVLDALEEAYMGTLLVAITPTQPII